MKRAALGIAHNDLRLWSAAVAALAIVLQTLLPGFAGFPVASAEAAHAAMVAHSTEHKGQDHGSMPECASCICCTGVAAAVPPALPALPLPQRNVSVSARRRVSVFRRTSPLADNRSARGPPRLA